MRAFLMRAVRELLSYRGRFNAIALYTLWVLVSVALEIGEQRPAYTVDASLLVGGLAILLMWVYAGYLIGSGKWRKGGAQ